MRPEQKSEILREVRNWIDTANVIYGTDVRVDHVRFDLKGRCAGQAIRKPGDWFEIRVNPEIAVQNWAEYIDQTIPHEVAHIVQYQVFPRCRGHGRAWKRIMRAFGKEPRRCHEYDLSTVKVRRQKRHEYACACRVHHLTTVRHNRVRRGQTNYSCKTCGTTLVKR